MNFYRTFWKTLRSRPIEALGALYWHITGRKVRARNRLRISPDQSPDAYSRWVALIERRGEIIAGAETTMAGWTRKPLFSILVSGRDYRSEAAIEQLIAMMQQQVYPHWELLVAGCAPAQTTDSSSKVRFLPGPASDVREALRTGASSARGMFVLPLLPDTCLAPTALLHYAEAVETHPDAIMLFGDEDRIDDTNQRHHPWFKPQWNDELSLAQDYVSRALVLSTTAARKALLHDLGANEAVNYALALAVAWSASQHVFHVAHVQSHVHDSAALDSEEDRISVVRAHIDCRGDSGVFVSAGRHDTVRVDWPLSDPPPSVTIIIPTRDKPELLRACLSSLFKKTLYSHYDVLVVDNGSRQADTLAYLCDLAERGKIRTIRDEDPYNFPRINNMAVGHAGGEYVCLLNNDTEIVDGGWLEAMMRQAVRPHVGAVGARLLYDDRTIQHAGVTIGLGDAAGHPHRFQHCDEIGYFARTHAAQYVSAVTAACLVIRKDKFVAVGGLDEDAFGVAFNDVDLCLKLAAAGWANVYTPHATLIHHESKTRGRDSSPEHVERYRQELATLRARWHTAGFIDPMHHRHLDRATEQPLIQL